MIYNLESERSSFCQTIIYPNRHGKLMNNRKTTYSTFSVVFYINRQKVKKDGLCPLMGRISINKEVGQFSAKMDIDPALWDAKNTGSKARAVIYWKSTVP